MLTSDWSRIMRNTIGWENKLMVDANQKWGVQQVGEKSGNKAQIWGGGPVWLCPAVF